jgi:hypothetical protein
MLTTKEEFARRLAAKVDEEVNREAEAMASGVVPSFEDYRHRAGKVAGLRLVIDLIADVEKDMAKR